MGWFNFSENGTWHTIHTFHTIRWKHLHLKSQRVLESYCYFWVSYSHVFFKLLFVVATSFESVSPLTARLSVQCPCCITSPCSAPVRLIKDNQVITNSIHVGHHNQNEMLQTNWLSAVGRCWEQAIRCWFVRTHRRTLTKPVASHRLCQAGPA